MTGDDLLFVGTADRKFHFCQRLADFAVGLVAGGMPERGKLHHQRHVAVQLIIDQPGIILRPVGQMDR